MSVTRITNDNVIDLASSKVTGSTSTFNDNDVVNDMSTLALRQASNENKAAYSEASMYVDVFQDSTGITGLTDVIRNSSEYIETISYGATQNLWEISNAGGAAGSGYNNYLTRTRVTSITATAHRLRFTVNTTGGGDLVQAGFAVAHGSSTHGSTNWDAVATPLEILWGGSSGASGGSQVSDWLYFTVSSANDYIFTSTNANNTNIYRYASGFPANTASCTQAGGTAGFGTLVADVPTDDSQSAVYFLKKIEGQAGTTNATGSFTSNNITASASTTSMGAVITYQDQAGTNALNSDIVMKLSADGGSNYATATLTAMPDFATGIKMAKVNDLAVTAGTSLKYKLEFANQASGSKEARIRGVALQY